MKKYLVIIEKTKTGYSAYVPDLPGCISTGKSKKDIEKNIQEAIEFHIEGMMMDGDKVPEPTNNYVFIGIKPPVKKNYAGSRVYKKRVQV